MSEYIVRMPPDMPYEIKAELNAWYVESEPVVRCRDCEFFVNDGRWGVCTQFDFETTEENIRNGFCAWGERAIERKPYRPKDDALCMADEVEEMHSEPIVVESEVVE